MSNEITSIKAELAQRWSADELFDPDLLGQRRRFMFLALAALQSDDKLRQCSRPSIIEGVTQAAQMGLAVNDGTERAYLLPYGSHAKLIIGYRGLLDIAYRSGLVASISSQAVYEGDAFEYSYGLHPDIQHKPSTSTEERKLTHVYGIVKFKSGECLFEVMSKRQIDDIKDRSPAGKSGPWVTDYPQMARKTVIRRVCNLVPNSGLARATSHEEREEMGLNDIEEYDAVEVEDE